MMLDATQIGASLGVAARTVYDWRRRRLIPSPQKVIGKTMLWTEESVQEIRKYHELKKNRYMRKDQAHDD